MKKAIILAVLCVSLWALIPVVAKLGQESLAPLVFLSPVLAAILLVVFFDEPFLPAYAVGLVLVIAAGLIGARS